MTTERHGTAVPNDGSVRRAFDDSDLVSGHRWSRLTCWPATSAARAGSRRRRAAAADPGAARGTRRVAANRSDGGRRPRARGSCSATTPARSSCARGIAIRSACRRRTASASSVDIQTADMTLRIRGARHAAARRASSTIRSPSRAGCRSISSGTYLESTIEGTTAEVTVETVHGNVRVVGGSGAIVVALGRRHRSPSRRPPARCRRRRSTKASGCRTSPAT